MTDSFVFGQVDACDLVGGEEDAVAAVERERADGQALAAEGLRNFPQPPPEADVVAGAADRADDLAVIVCDLRQVLRHGARTWPVAAGGNILAERLVRSLEVVDGAPGIDRALDLGEIAEASMGEHLGLQRAVEAFDLAAALRMIRTAVQHPDAELEQIRRRAGSSARPEASPHGAPLSTKNASGRP